MIRLLSRLDDDPSVGATYEGTLMAGQARKDLKWLGPHPQGGFTKLGFGVYLFLYIGYLIEMLLQAGGHTIILAKFGLENTRLTRITERLCSFGIGIEQI